MDIAGVNYYVTHEGIPDLLRDQTAEVIDESGEQEGIAWLSPMIYPEKHEFSALIRNQIFVIGYREMNRVLHGEQTKALVREYHGRNS